MGQHYYHFDAEKSEYCDEWYEPYYICAKCHLIFMISNYKTDKPKFCPGCGNKIKTIKYGNEYITEVEEIDKN